MEPIGGVLRDGLDVGVAHRNAVRRVAVRAIDLHRARPHRLQAVRVGLNAGGALCRVFGQMKNNEAIAISRIEGGSASRLSATGARAKRRCR